MYDPSDFSTVIFFFLSVSSQSSRVNSGPSLKVFFFLNELKESSFELIHSCHTGQLRLYRAYKRASMSDVVSANLKSSVFLFLGGTIKILKTWQDAFKLSLDNITPDFVP